VIEALLERFPFDAELERAARAAVKRFDPGARAVEQATVRARVLRAFMDEGIAESDLAPAYGYGYDDPARARYESLLARIFGAERALARLSLVSGTHAIVTAVEACLPPNGRLICAAGRPYDTLRNALVEADYAIARRGARYAEVPLGSNGAVDYPALERECEGGADVVFVQRSRGYAPRPSLGALECGTIAACVRRIAPSAFVLVDNCYGELVESSEPTHHGVDAVMGSLIKNLGGGLAPAGAYVIGRAEVVERVAARHYAPGLGDAVGPSPHSGPLLRAAHRRRMPCRPRSRRRAVRRTRRDRRPATRGEPARYRSSDPPGLAAAPDRLRARPAARHASQRPLRPRTGARAGLS
jgi:cystathionine beta-lyase family protein involved in aluminum resistance